MPTAFFFLYLLALGIAWVFRLCYRGWFGLYLPLVMIAVPILVLALSLPAMLSVRMKMETHPYITRGAAGELELHFTARRFFPVGSVKLMLHVENRFTGEVNKIPVVYHGLGTSVQKVELPTEFCGLLNIRVQRWECRDMLGLFRLKRKSPDAVSCTVLPPAAAPDRPVDLDAALNAAEALPEAAGLPVCLFGHSMGAYAACAVLPDHPEVRAVAALAGFDSTAAWMQEHFGFLGVLLTPGAALWERIRFGSAAGTNSMEGFAASNAQILIVHSSDDPEVPIGCGLDRYAETYGSDPRFLFFRLDHGGHGELFTAEVQAACSDLFRRARER